MLARILLALFFGSCLWLEIRSQGTRRAPEIKPPVFADLNSASESVGEVSGSSAQEYELRPQGGTLLTEAVHWVYLAYNEKSGSSKRADQQARP